MSIPGSASPLFFQTAAGADTAANITKSVRFNSGDSAYLNRTPSSAGSNTTWTLSTWVKKTGNDNHIFGAGAGNTPGRFGFGFNGSDKIFAFVIASNSTVFSITTDAVFRDSSAWYHLVLIADTGNSTQADRFKIYVNGVLQSVSGTLMPTSQNTFVNTTAAHTFGRRSYTASDYFNGYLASTILVDGTAKDETDFGAFDDNGVWQASSYSGSFGTNGFHLFDFANETGIGNDSSGNDNDFTANNLVAATGSPQTSAITNVSNSTTTLSYSAQFVKASSESITTNQYNASSTAGLFACWMKHEGGTLSNDGSNRPWIFAAGPTGGNHTILTVTTSKKLNFYDYQDGSITFSVTQTSSVDLADGSWHHVLVRWDTSQSTSTDRVKIWIDGTEETLSGTFPSQNGTQQILNSNNKHYLADQAYERKYWDCKLAQVVLLNGAQTYTASDFLTADGKPKTSLSITFTNPSVYLTFADSSNLGDNTSGYANDWSVNGTPTRETSDTPSVKTSVLTFTNNNGFGDFTTGMAVTQSDDAASGTLYAIASGSNQMTVQRVTGNFATTKLLNGPSLGDPEDLDILFDVPKNGDSSDDTGAGGELSSNYATLNPLVKGTSLTMTNGSLALDQSVAGWDSAYSTIFLPSGKWYAEFTIRGRDSTNSYGILVGLAGDDTYIVNSEISSGNTYAVQNMGSMVKVNHNGGSTNIENIGHYAVGDVLQLAYDADNGKLWFGRNNTWINSGNPSSGTNATQSSISGTYCFAVALLHTGDKIDCNFGQRAWAYSAPTNFKAVCTSNLPTPTIADGSDYFEARTYNGDTTTSQSGFEFSPDFVWLKSRSNADGHFLFDTVRGATKYLSTHNSNDENTISNSLTSFDSDGFSYGSWGPVNNSSMIAWCWDAASSNATNNDGSITTTVRANTTAGFSIATYSGTDSGSSQTLGHGLNAAPKLWIFKNRSADSSDWIVYTTAIDGSSDYSKLNDIDAFAAGVSPWSTAPTSSVITVGTNNLDTCKAGNDYLLLAFTPVAGYSAFGSYTANGNTDGPFVYTGFSVKWLLTRRSNQSENWNIHDTARSPYNAADEINWANLANTELANNTNRGIDLLSNGFKLRGNDTGVNSGNHTYFYAAFAENPFQANGGLAR